VGAAVAHVRAGFTLLQVVVLQLLAVDAAVAASKRRSTTTWRPAGTGSWAFNLRISTI